MKTSVMVVVALALMIMASTMVAAEDLTGTLTAAQYAKAEENLLLGLKSDNTGVREGSAYLLGELRSAKAVLPLMAMLRNGENESSRIVAALALTRIGDGRGVFAVKRAAIFDGSERVQQRCAFFVNAYAEPGTFAFDGFDESGIEMAHK